MMKYIPSPHDEVPVPPHDEVPPPHGEVPLPHGEASLPYNGMCNVPNAGSFDTNPPPY